MSAQRPRSGARARERGPIAYLVSRFPAVTETFVLEELGDLKARGVDVEVFPLFGSWGGEVHAAWRALEPHTHYHAALSWELVAAQVHWLRRRPRAYLGAWWDALRLSAPSRKLLVRAPVVIAKAALVARRVEALGVRHVHAHFATHPALAAWVVRALAGTEYSFTAHAHDLYVDTAMLREKVAGARFVVTISEFNRAFLEARCAPGDAAKIHVVELLGARPHEDIPALLAGATAMVLPSVRARDGQMEGIPVALMEAMAAGVPVVATRLSGIPELVVDGETGLLVPERDPAALAGAMERLARDAALGARLARAARREVQERFDRSRNVAALEALLLGPERERRARGRRARDEPARAAAPS